MGQFRLFAAVVLSAAALSAATCPSAWAEGDEAPPQATTPQETTPQETETTKTITVIQPMPTDERTVYLASYRSKKAAMTGFKRLQGQTPALGDATPEFKSVDIPKKGRFIRLYAKVNGPEAADHICNDLIGTLPDCGSEKR